MKPLCNCTILQPVKPTEVCSDRDILFRYKLHKTKLSIGFAQKSAQANLNFIRQELSAVGHEIQAIKGKIEKLGAFDINDADTDCRRLSAIGKVKRSLNTDLYNLLQQECNLKRRLSFARLQHRNARIDEILLKEQLTKFNEECWEKDCLKRTEMAKKRWKREQATKKNALFVREATITSVANAITSHVLQNFPGEHNTTTQLTQIVKNARRDIEQHISKSFKNARQKKVIKATEYQLRHRRQVEDLLKLKEDISDIKKSMSMKSNLKRIQDEGVAQEQEEVKALLSTQGVNPYLAEYILALEEKQREMQRRMLVEEQKKLIDLKREYSSFDALQNRRESRRKKWEQFWDEKTKEKILMEKQKKQVLYFGTSPGEYEETLTYSDSKRVTRMTETDDTYNMRVSIKAASSRGKATDKRKFQSQGGKSHQPHLLPTRKALHLDAQQKESLLQIAGENAKKTVLMDGGQNVFDFGDVPVGEKKYKTVNVANIGSEPVRLKMSALDPYGPFVFCNSLKEIPPDSYFSLKYKFQPGEGGQSQETVKIEEVGKLENFILVKLRGKGIRFSQMNVRQTVSENMSKGKGPRFSSIGGSTV